MWDCCFKKVIKFLNILYKHGGHIVKKVTDRLERMQQRTTKMIPELTDLSYESRLLECRLTTLETRKLRGDQIEVSKTVNGYADIGSNMFFKLKDGSRTRG